MIKIVEISGEQKVECPSGQNTIVKNLGTNVIYASAEPITENNAAEIAPGAGEVIYDTNGTVYLSGEGRVQLTGTNYSTVNFKIPSIIGTTSSYDVMPIMDGITGYFIPETIDIGQFFWKNVIKDNDNMSISKNAALTDKGYLHLVEGQQGIYNIDREQLTIYAMFRNVEVPAGQLSARTVFSKTTGVIRNQFSVQTSNNANPSGQIGIYTGRNYGAYSDVVANYNIHCVCTITVDDSATLYVDGEKTINNTAYASGSFQEEYTINLRHLGIGGNIDDRNNAEYIMLAFGDTMHTESQVLENMAWLMTKYMG